MTITVHLYELSICSHVVMSFSEIKLGYMEFHYYYMRHETCTNRLGLGWGWVRMCWDGMGLVLVLGTGFWLILGLGSN